jgi:hypothetical protein
MPLIDLSGPVVVLREGVGEVDGGRLESERNVGAAGEGLRGAPPGTAQPKSEVAVSKPALQPDASAVLIAYALVAAGGAFGIALWAWRHPPGFTPGDGISVFAPLYILAQAIERFIEPFSSYLGSAAPDDAPADQPAGKKNKADALELLNQAVAMKDAPAAAAWARVVDKIRRNTAVVAWGLASFLGMVLCGLFGLYMMRLVGFTGVPKQVDIVLSGLAVGSGTKPLHDLISNVQKAKEQKEDPPEKKAA